MSTKQKSNILILLILVGVVFFSALGYWLWVRSTALPVLGEIESFTLETVEGKSYQPKNDKLKLVMFYEEGCKEGCQNTLTVMENLQNNFNEAGILGRDVELLSLILSTEEKHLQQIKAYMSNHNIGSNDWKFLTGSSEELAKVKKQISVASNKKIDDDTYVPEIYLVDKKGRIRGNYETADLKTSNIELITEEVKNLVRVQPAAE
jgi:protein SCO1